MGMQGYLVLIAAQWLCSGAWTASGLRYETFLNQAIAVCPGASCNDSCHVTREAEDTCHCDAICEMYGDCCYDYWSACKNETFQIPRDTSMPQDRLVCRAIGGIHCHLSIKMIAACPESFDRTLVSSRCETFSLGYMAPVYGNRGYVYANKFCAQCHGEKPSDLLTLPTSLECPEDPLLSQIFQNLTVDDEESWWTLQSSCHYNISVPTSLEPYVRFCSQMKEYDSSCRYRPEIFQSREEYDMLYRACNSYQGFITTQYRSRFQSDVYLSRAFKNTHCVKCSGKAHIEHNVTCPISGRRRVKRQQCLTGPGPIPGPSFTILLDFGNDFSTALVETFRSCPAGHTYESVSALCKPVKCPQGYRLLDTTCVRQTGPSDFMTATLTVDFQGTFDKKYALPQKLISDLFDNLGSAYNFTYVQRSSENVYRVTGQYKILSDESIFQAAVDGLMFCEMIVNQTKALTMRRPRAVTIQCNVSAQSGDDPENCFHVIAQNHSFINTISQGINHFSLMDEVEDEDILVRVFVSLRDAFDEGSSCFTGKLSVTECSIPSLICPLLEVDSALVASRNSTHLLLQTGEFYGAHEFKIMENQTYICTEIVENFTEITQPMFTLQIGENIAHYYMTVVGLSLSIAGLTLTLVVYMALDTLRTVPGKILMNLSLSLLLAQFFFAFGTDKMAWPTFCIANAVLEHYLWLVSFFWMNVISLDLAKTFMSSSLLSHDDRGHSLLGVYTVYSWGLPLLEVATCFFLDMKDAVADDQLKYGSIGACFLSGYNGMLYAFVLPLTVIMVVNIICFIGVLVMLTKASSLEKKIQKNRMKRNQHFLLAKLLPITGLTWTFGVVATFSKIAFLWNPFIILNSLQGVFVFCAFVLNSRVKRMLKAKLSQISQETTGTSNTRF